MAYAVIGLIIVAALTLIGGAAWFGDWATALVATIGATIAAVPFSAVYQWRLQVDTEAKLTGGRTADRSFFVHELRQRDAEYNQKIETLAHEAGVAHGKLELIQAKSRARTIQARGPAGKFITVDHAEP